MSQPGLHARLLPFPHGISPAGGWLEMIRGSRTDLVLDYQALQLTQPVELSSADGKLYETIAGLAVPRRIRFQDVHFLEGGNILGYFADLPADHTPPPISAALAWRYQATDYYLFGVRLEAHPDFLLTARCCLAEERPGELQPVSVTRNWSPPPDSPPRLVPNPILFRQRFGGDPVTIHLNGHTLHRRLFIGGVDIQGENRPAVDAVLNLGEASSRWVAQNPTHPEDRWENKGEGSEGMAPAEIASEARWVIERLQAGKRVLVHCAAGMNRSATICTAVLILLENLSAGEALVRVRQHHPWARPDSHHWLALRWLAQHPNS